MKGNPYPGARPFESTDQDRFFGRRQEVEILAAQVLARRASLLFAPSGAGKSSLIHAGLVPELSRGEEVGRGRRRRTVYKMTVLPVASVGGGIPARLERPPDNVYVFSALYSLFPDADPADLAGRRLADAVAPLLEDDREEPVLLVFDQLEELFTHNVERWEERLPFFEELVEAIRRHPRLHLLFSMREDFIAELTPFAGLFPGGLRDRFRIERLRPAAALDAVRRPAEQAGRPFAAGVAEELVDNLRRAQRGRRQERSPAAPGGASRLGELVEPVHLQIVCRRLWDDLDDDGTVIESGDLHRFGDVDQALRGFYAGGLQRALERTEVPEHRLRAWFEDTTLITPAHTRGLVYRGDETTEGLPNAAVDELVDAYLVRSVRRGGDVWYELAHDRLVEPILAANRAWRAEHLKPVTVAAEAWAASDRDPRKLYSGGLLTDARRDVAIRPEDCSDLELEFLEAGAARERAAARRRRFQLLAGFGVLAVLLYLTWMSYRQRNIAISRQLAASSTQVIEENPQLALGFALDAIKRNRTVQAERALRMALLEPYVIEEQDTPAHPEIDSDETSTGTCSLDEVRRTIHYQSATFSPDGRYLAVGRTDGLVLRIADTDDCIDAIHRGEGLLIAAHREQVTDVAFSERGDYLLSASNDGTAAVWAARSGRLLARLRGYQPRGARSLAAAFDRDRSRIRTWTPPEETIPNGTVRWWRVNLPRILEHDLGEVFAVELSPDGRYVVAVGNLEARVWETETGNEIQSLGAEGDLVNDATFSPDGHWVATAGGDGVVRVESLEGSPARHLGRHEGSVREITFSRRGDRLLSIGDADDTARLWNWQTEEELARFEHAGLTSAALSPEANLVVTTGGTSVTLWTSTGEKAGGPEHPSTDQQVESASFGPLGRSVATVDDEGAVRLWEVGEKHLVQLDLAEKPLDGASFSPRGDSLVAWSQDSAFLWWPHDGNRDVELGGHDGDLGEPSFSKDGELVLTFDGTRARTWDATSTLRRLLAELPLDLGGAIPRPSASAMSWSADGRQLAVAWDDESVEIRFCEVCGPFEEVLESARRR